MSYPDTHVIGEICGPRRPSTDLANKSHYLFVQVDDEGLAGRRRGPSSAIINSHVQHQQNRKKKAAAIRRLKPTKTNALVRHECPGKRRSSGNRTLQGIQQPTPEVSPPNQHADLTKSSSSSDAPRLVVRRKSPPDLVCPTCETIITVEYSVEFEGEYLGYPGTADEKAAPTAHRKYLVNSKTNRTLGDFLSEKTLPSTQLSTSHVDPFATASIPITQNMNFALHHYIKQLVPSYLPPPSVAHSVNLWTIPLAFQSPLLLYAIIAKAVAHLEALGGGFDKISTPFRLDLDASYYKLQSLQLINKAVMSSTEAVKPSTIYAIHCLLCIEQMTGDEFEATAHLNGLQKLITLRGGFQELPVPVIQELVGVCHLQAIVTRSPPALEPPPITKEVPRGLVAEIQSGTGPDMEPVGQGLLSGHESAYFSPEMLGILSDMRESTLFKEYVVQNELGPSFTGSEIMAIKRMHILHRLLTFNSKENNPALRKDIEEVVRLALLVFWNANLMLHQSSSAIFRSLTAQLKHALERTDLRFFWTPLTDALVWVLFLGAHISIGQRQRPWFVMQIARGAQILNIGEWHNVRALLQRFFYLDRVYLTSYQNIWEEVQLLVDVMPTTWHS